MTVIRNLFWTTNKEWYTYNNDGEMVIKESAPQEAQDSYAKYLVEIKDAEIRKAL